MMSDSCFMQGYRGKMQYFAFLPKKQALLLKNLRILSLVHEKLMLQIVPVKLTAAISCAIIKMQK